MSESKYLKYFPKPLLDDIVNNKCVPLIGAGLSLNASLPAGKKMPLWSQLATELGKDLPTYTSSSTLDLISAYEYEFSRSKLIERLFDLLMIEQSEPGSTHLAFCQVPFELVITTNWDFLLEKGYEKINKKVQTIVEEDQLPINRYSPDLTLLKLHGDLNYPKQLVATEKDYDNFLENNPLLSTFFANLMITRTPLLIGYSLDDQDLRQLWQIIGDRLGSLRRPAYVLQIDSSPSNIARYDRRGIKVINIPSEGISYSEILKEVFTEICEYWEEHYSTVSPITLDQTRADLQLPKGTKSTLCFFSVPQHSLSLYKSEIYPIVTELGLNPVSVEDFGPGTNTAAAKLTLLQRAAVVIAEMEDSWVIQELINSKRDLPVLLVSEREAHYEKQGWRVVAKPTTDIAVEMFVQAVQEWLEDQCRKLFSEIQTEAERLLQAGFFNPAVFAAFTAFELVLREWAERESVHTKGVHIVSFLAQIKALANTRIDQRLDLDLGLIQEWRRLRNQAIHQGTQISSDQATEIVKGLQSLINVLSNLDRSSNDKKDSADDEGTS